MGVRTVSAALAALVVAAGAAGIARAEIVHFVNPAPGEAGHFEWRGEVWGLHVYLDVTRAATDQPDVLSGSSLGQWAWMFQPGVSIEGFAELSVVSETTARARFLALGDALTEVAYSNYGECEYGGLPTGVHRYLGVRTAGGNYGWVEVEWAEDTRLGLRAHSWAYETEPGVPLLAGQVPAPGAAALLGIGALTAVRRKRTSFL